MKKSHLAMAACALLMPLAVACSSSNDIAKDNPSTSPASSPNTSPTTTPPTSPTPTEPSTPSVSVTSSPPSDDGRLRGSDFSVAVPDGWEDITASVKASQPTVDIAMGETQASGFRTNFNVVNNHSHPGTIEDNGPAIRKEAASELKTITKKPVTSLPDRTVDGDAAIGQTSTFVSSGTSVTFIQYFVVHDGDAYPITMTFATENKTDARNLLDQILASWQWSS